MSKQGRIRGVAVRLEVVCTDHPGDEGVMFRACFNDEHGFWIERRTGWVAGRQPGYGSKWTDRCPVGCRRSPEFVSNRLHSVLTAIARPGEDEIWRVTDDELEAMVRRPDLARVYLDSR